MDGGAADGDNGFHCTRLEIGDQAVAQQSQAFVHRLLEDELEHTLAQLRAGGPKSVSGYTLRTPAYLSATSTASNAGRQTYEFSRAELYEINLPG